MDLVHAAVTAARDANHVAVELAKAGKSDEAIALFIEKGEDGRGAIDRAIHKIMEANERSLAQQNIATAALVARMRWVMYGGSALGILVAFAMGFAITRSVTQPLGASRRHRESGLGR